MTQAKWVVALIVGGVAFCMASSTTVWAQWQPKKPVNMVVMAGKGGGAGKLSRLFQAIIEKNGFSNQPFIPEYKPGGSGAEALIFMKDQAGDPHTILMTLNSYFTTPLRQPKLGIDIAEFTPIARMALDTFVLWVNSSAGINDLNQFVETVRKDGRSWTMGGTGRGQEDQLLTNLLESTFSLRMTYAPFKGGGTVAKNLAGKHVNSTVNNPAEALGWWEAKKVRPLAAFTPKRLEVFPDVPTFRELGHSGMEYYMQRSIVGPPNMPKEAVDFYVEVFRKVHESADWKSHTSKKALFRDFLTGNDLQNYFLAERDKHRELLRKTGEL